MAFRAATTSATLALLVVVHVSVSAVEANAFLGRHDDTRGAPDPEFQLHLLEEMEAILGTEHRAFTEKRLKRIEDDLRPMFAAMPKTANGKLEHAAVNYMLHRAFVQRHGWFVRSLSGESKTMSMWNSSSAAGTILEDKVSDDVIDAFEKRMGSDGTGLHEIAVLAATLEHLAHKEALERLYWSYEAFNFKYEDVVSTEEAGSIMEAYLAIYILGGYLKAMSNSTRLQPSKIRILLDRIEGVYPTWKSTLKFANEVKQRTAPNRDYMYFADVANTIEEIGEHYGEFQDRECLVMRDQLKNVEQPGSPGRVRLADFYKLSKTLKDGFYSESKNYLRELGALDESDPSNPRVLTSNYINGPSNCIASSEYYSVCCRDECENLLSKLEVQLQASEATPAQITTMVAALPSRTEPAGPTLSPWLLTRLDEVAKHHGGRIPLHGRLFAQWMHYAYPRECAFPHVSGAVAPPKLETILADPKFKESLDSIVASAEEMDRHIEDAPNATYQEEHNSQSMWTLEEELLVSRPEGGLTEQSGFPAFASIRGVVFFAAILSVTMALHSRSPGKWGSKCYAVNEKYMV